MHFSQSADGTQILESLILEQKPGAGFRAQLGTLVEELRALCALRRATLVAWLLALDCSCSCLFIDLPRGRVWGKCRIKMQCVSAVSPSGAFEKDRRSEHAEDKVSRAHLRANVNETKSYRGEQCQRKPPPANVRQVLP
jgi:hypothetical protein